LSGQIAGSTLLGGSSNDTFNLTASTGVTNTRIIAGAGDDSILFDGFVTGASIVGGTGNDVVSFTFAPANSVAAVNNGAFSNTYFFAASGGADTFSFTNRSVSSGTVPMTIAVDSSYGATSNFSFTSTTSLISFGSGGTIFMSGVTGTTINSVASLGFTFTTVSSSVITALG
jgi:hypothetical protein